MKRPIIALVALALSSPAVAAGYPYVTVEGGIARAKDNDVDLSVQYVTAPGGPRKRPFYDDSSAGYKNGVDVRAAAVTFRLVSRRRRARDKGRDRQERRDDITTSSSLISRTLNRPSALPDPVARASRPDHRRLQPGARSPPSAIVNGRSTSSYSGLQRLCGVGFGPRSSAACGHDRRSPAASSAPATRQALLDGAQVPRFSSGITAAHTIATPAPPFGRAGSQTTNGR